MHPAALPSDDDLIRGRHLLGDLEIILCSDGPFLLDGGAMFGVVPRTLWQQRAPADENNNILLGLNTVVIRSANATVLIETGIGNKQSSKMRSIHQNHERLPASLAAAGISPLEVTHVINTHLHFDHCGWNTTLHADGTVTPTFPNARYFAAAGELAHGRLQLDRDRVSYLAPNYDPLIRSGQLTLIDPHGTDAFTPTDPRLTGPNPLPPIPIQTNLDITPRISVECFRGHTETMLAVHIESRSHGGASEHACYISDLIPTHNHLDPTWVMSFDLDPITCIAQRKRFLASAIPNNWLVLFTHDHQLPAAHIHLNEKGRPTARAPQDI
jgi:glyoxylase-like metal-dependent hydrolase (beta-lactamase superfamily II)